MPNSYASYAYATEEYAGPPVANSPAVTVDGGQFPTTLLEIAPGYGPNDSAPVWINIGADVTQVQTRRGRQRILGRFEAGTMNVTVDNKTGRYSPFNPSSPYYNLITPGMPIRFRALWGAITYYEFSGTVETWPLGWPTANDSSVTITAVDAMKFLNLKKAGSIVAYAAAVAADAPYGWWRMNDPQLTLVTTPPSAQGPNTYTNVVLDSSGHGLHGSLYDYTGTEDISGTHFAETVNWYQQAPPLLVADTTASTLFGAKTYGYGQITVRTLAVPGAGALPQAMTFEAWVSMPSGGGGTVLSSIYASTRWLSLGVSADSASWSGPATASYTGALSQSQAHHVVGTITADANPVMTLYVDGVQVAQDTAAGGWLGGTPSAVVIGGQDSFTGFSPKTRWIGQIQEAAVYNYVLTAAQVLTHYNAGAHPRQLETTGARIAYLASYTSIPTSAQAFDTGATTVQGATGKWLSNSILANMQEQADTEGGDLFIDTVGKITFFDRYHTSRSPYGSVSLLLGDNPLGNASSLRLPGTSGNYVSTPDSAANSAGSNQLTVNQSGIETDASGWTATLNCSVSQTAAQALDGTKSLQISSTAAGTVQVVASTRPTVLPNTSYTMSAWCRAATVARSCLAQFSWYDSSGVFISNVNAGSSANDTTTGWTQIGGSATSPSNAASVQVIVDVISTGAGAEVHYIDRISCVQGTGDLDLRVKLAMDTWIPAGTAGLIGKWSTGSSISWLLTVNPTTGTLSFSWSREGTVQQFQTSTVGTGFAAGSINWIRATFTASTGQVTFYISADGVTYTPLGTLPTAAGGQTIFDSTSPIELGSWLLGTSGNFAGNIFYAEVRNGIGGPVVASFDATKVTPSTATSPNFYTNLTTSEVWTVNGAGWSWVTGPNIEEPYRLDSLTVAYDDQDIVNDVTVTPDNLAPQNASDTASQTTYGKRSQTMASVASTVAVAAGQAATIVALNKAPVPRIDSVTVVPTDDPTMLFGPVLGSDLLTRIKVRRRPKDGASSTFDQTALIEGIEHRVTKGQWQTTWRLSSTDAYRFFILDDPVAGVLDDPLNILGW